MSGEVFFLRAQNQERSPQQSRKRRLESKRENVTRVLPEQPAWCGRHSDKAKVVCGCAVPCKTASITW